MSGSPPIVSQGDEQPESGDERMKLAVLMVLLARAVAQGGTPQEKVAVYVQNNAGVSFEVRVLAQSLATQMFARIGVKLEFPPGRPAGHTSSRKIVVELADKTPPDFQPGALAYATPYEGQHIRIFCDRIGTENLSPRFYLLAHVLVHEISHLLEGTCWHSDHGIMKAKWTGEDLAQMQRRPLGFTDEDIRLIHSGLSSVTSPPVSERAAGTR